MSAAPKKRSKIVLVLTVFFVIMLLAGLGIMLYPTVSNWVYTHIQSKQISTYDVAVASLSDEERESYLSAAREYNEKLVEVGIGAALANPDLLDGYYDILDVSGTGIMGYVTIEKIGVQLPIYHGTSTAVLQVGSGHLQGTSFPIGGESTHSVLSGHRGLPSALLFTRLDEMEVGDTFSVTILDETLTYRVDQIEVVLPEEIANLEITEGKDYCTLMTCTPYGINTHRLLVRGVRLDDADVPTVTVTSDAYKYGVAMVAPVLVVPIAAIALVVLFVLNRRERKREENTTDIKNIKNNKNNKSNKNK